MIASPLGLAERALPPIERPGPAELALARRAVDGDDAPAVAEAGAVDVVDAGQRAVLHRERETGLRLEAEREPQGGADRAAMRDGDDVAAAVWVENRVDRARDALHHVDEAFAAGRPLMRRRVPKAVELPAARMAQLVVGQALPVAEALLGEVGDRRGLWPRDPIGAGQPGADDRLCRLVG